eukprot:m.36205 g.36205  ORF g.36205 m.36205 type:complete len:698 (-) comp5378_c0_seq1:168-2261(-)
MRKPPWRASHPCCVHASPLHASAAELDSRHRIPDQAAVKPPQRGWSATHHGLSVGHGHFPSIRKRGCHLSECVCELPGYAAYTMIKKKLFRHPLFFVITALAVLELVVQVRNKSTVMPTSEPLAPSPERKSVLGAGSQLQQALQSRARQDTSADLPAKQTDLIVGVLTDPNSLRTVGMAVYTTWARECESFATVVFFIGSCSSEVEGFPGKIICLDTPDTYPPQRKVFLMWKYYYDHFLHVHKLFMKVDHDSYVSAPSLRQLAHFLAEPKRIEAPIYLGLPASGRKEEQKALGLDGQLYCSGLGYIINTNVLASIGPHLLTCLGDSVSNHSDTEMGRCVFAHTDTECRRESPFEFRQIYYQQEGNMVFPMKLIRGGQMKLKFMHMPKAVHFDSVVLHPLKRAEDFYRFHKQVMSRLRPVQPPISRESFDVSYRQATNDLKTTCVHNTIRQSELYQYPLDECEPSDRQLPASIPSVVHIIARDTFDGRRSLDSLTSTLTENGFDVHPAILAADTPKEYLSTMYGVFRNLSLASVRSAIIMEAETELHCEFRSQLQAVLAAPRCANHLFTFQEGGVLLLGADVPAPDQFALVEQDRADAFQVYENVNASLCFNAYSNLTGSFAGLYHRGSYGEILAWLHLNMHSDSPPPFAEVFHTLSDKGYVVRGAYPTLVFRGKPETTSAKQSAIAMQWQDRRRCSV